MRPRAGRFRPGSGGPAYAAPCRCRRPIHPASACPTADPTAPAPAAAAAGRGARPARRLRAAWCGSRPGSVPRCGRGPRLPLRPASPRHARRRPAARPRPAACRASSAGRRRRRGSGTRCSRHRGHASAAHAVGRAGSRRHARMAPPIAGLPHRRSASLGTRPATGRAHAGAWRYGAARRHGGQRRSAADRPATGRVLAPAGAGQGRKMAVAETRY
ncbi:hypothetical protein D3C71_1289220 [compost metagenome]